MLKIDHQFPIGSSHIIVDIPLGQRMLSEALVTNRRRARQPEFFEFYFLLLTPSLGSYSPLFQ